MSSSDNPVPTLSPADLLGGARADALQRLARRPGARTDQELERAAKDFESVLLQKLMEEMKDTIPDSGLLDSGVTKQVQGIFWDHLAQDIARQGGIGLWKQLYTQWSQTGPPPTQGDPAAPAEAT